MIKACNRIIEYSFYALFFFVPLVVASDTSELFEFNKMWLAFGLTLIIGAAWGTKMIRLSRIWIQRTPLDIPILLFLLSQFIATIFSWDVYISFWGYYSRFNGGLLSIATYIFLYYAFLSNFSTNAASMVKRLLLISLFSGLVVGLWGLPSHFGYDPTCFLFRGTFDVSCWTEDFQPKIRIFSTLGQPAWLAAYLAILLPISIIMFIKFIKNLPLSIFYLLLSVLFYLDLLYTQARSGIIAVWLSLAFFVIGYLLVIKRQLLKLLVLLIVLFSLTFFIGTPFSQLRQFTFGGIKADPPANPSIPSQHFGELGGTDSGKIRSIVWRGAINIWSKYPLFGTGVETFAFAYYRHKPVAQNLVSEWNFLYNKAHNEYLNYLATTGLFGLGTYLLMIGWFIILSLKQFKIQNSKLKVEVKNSKLGNEKLLTLNCNFELCTLNFALLAAYFSILITNFFGFSVVITNIYLFMIPAFVFVLGGIIKPEKILAFPRSELRIMNYESRMSVFQWMLVCSIILTSLFIILNLFNFWIADKNYSLGYNLDRAGEYQKAYPYLHKAVQYRDEPVFKDELAVNDAILAVTLLSQKDSGENKEDLKAQANSLKHEAIETSDQLTASHEHNVVFWKTRTRIFYTLSQIDSQYLPQALQAIEKAAELAPNDASISYNLGVLYGQNNDVQKGIETLEKTIQLKPNYRDAYYALGLFYRDQAVDEKGNIIDKDKAQKAIDQMQYILDNLSPNDPAAKETLKNWKGK